MERLRRWVKSVLPPEDKFVGWIDMSNPAAPIKKICMDGTWATVGQLSYDEGYNTAIAVIEKYTVKATPIGVVAATENSTASGEGGDMTIIKSTELGEYTPIADFDVSDMTNGDYYLFVYSSTPSLTNIASAKHSNGEVKLVIPVKENPNYEVVSVEDVGYIILPTDAPLEEDTGEE